MRADDLLLAAGDVLLGARCHGCGRPGTGCCAACVAALAEPVRPVLRAGRDLPPTWAAGEHDGIRRAMVVACKDEGAWTLLGLLGDELARSVAAALLALDLPGATLVPAPSRPASVRKRGLDVTAALTDRAARRLTRLGAPCRSAAVLRQRPGARDQVGLTAAGRAANVAHRMACLRAVAGPVVLVDDIVTTGATLAEGTACLTTAGADVVACATISARGWT